MKIKKGDTVLIITGKDRGKRAKVLDIFPGSNRALVEGVNLRKKHVKPKKSGEKGFEKLLGYGKEKFVAALLPVGVPDEDPPARSRKPLEEMMKVIE